MTTAVNIFRASILNFSSKTFKTPLDVKEMTPKALAQQYFIPSSNPLIPSQSRLDNNLTLESFTCIKVIFREQFSLLIRALEKKNNSALKKKY
jgi:hypothetical protein